MLFIADAMRDSPNNPVVGPLAPADRVRHRARHATGKARRTAGNPGRISTRKR